MGNLSRQVIGIFHFGFEVCVGGQLGLFYLYNVVHLTYFFSYILNLTLFGNQRINRFHKRSNKDITLLYFVHSAFHLWTALELAYLIIKAAHIIISSTFPFLVVYETMVHLSTVS